MPHWENKRPIAIVSACMTPNGTPTFAHNEVEVTQDEAENGVHYYLVEAQLLEDGYEEPFVHFDDREAPPFLMPAVRQHLGLSPAAMDPSTPALTENC